jgi:hypothetical protein
MKLTDSQLALRYTLAEWERLHGAGQIPPMELSRSIVYAVRQLGYTRKLVDKMIADWKKVK